MRKPPATATPFTFRWRASPRLYNSISSTIGPVPAFPSVHPAIGYLASLLFNFLYDLTKTWIFRKLSELACVLQIVL